MKNYEKEIIKLTAKEVLSGIFNFAIPFFEASSVYRVSARKYKNEHEDRPSYSERIQYLKKQGLIETFIEGKERFIEITPKGLQTIRKIKENDLVIERPEHWDGKWRVVIFDVPNKNKNARDLFRIKLVELGFLKVQESVYVHPFECTSIVASLTERFSINNNVLIMVSEIIQGEDNFIRLFLDKKIINDSDLKKPVTLHARAKK